jgi:putative SOS response-associated peptidase YedK
MPVILPPEDYDAWLSGEAGKEVLRPYPAPEMKAWPISSRVNSPRNNDSHLLEPAEPVACGFQDDLFSNN